MLIYGCALRESPSARNSDYFIKYYGESGDQKGVDVLPAPDGGFYILGSTQIRDSVTSALRNSDVILIRTDELGNEIWRQTYSDPDKFTSAVKMDFTDNGGIAIVGQILQGTNLGLFILVTDADGNPLAAREYGSTFNYKASWIDAYPGGIVVCGTTDSIPAGETSGSYLFSYNVDDQTLQDVTFPWTTRYGFANKIDSGTAVIYQGDNNGTPEFLFYMSTDNEATNAVQDGLSGLNFFSFFSTDGNVSGRSTYFGNTNDQIAKSVSATEVGNTYIVGNSSSDGGASNNSIGLGKANTANERLGFVEVTSISDVIVSNAIPWGEQGVTIVGERLSGTQKDIYLARFDNSGATVWEKTFGFPEFQDFGGNLLELSDGNIVFTGTIRLDNQDKICLIKVKSDGSMRP